MFKFYFVMEAKKGSRSKELFVTKLYQRESWETKNIPKLIQILETKRDPIMIQSLGTKRDPIMIQSEETKNEI